MDIQSLTKKIQVSINEYKNTKDKGEIKGVIKLFFNLISEEKSTLLQSLIQEDKKHLFRGFNNAEKSELFKELSCAKNFDEKIELFRLMSQQEKKRLFQSLENEEEIKLFQSIHSIQRKIFEFRKKEAEGKIKEAENKAFPTEDFAIEAENLANEAKGILKEAKEQFLGLNNADKLLLFRALNRGNKIMLLENLSYSEKSDIFRILDFNNNYVEKIVLIRSMGYQEKKNLIETMSYEEKMELFHSFKYKDGYDEKLYLFRFMNYSEKLRSFRSLNYEDCYEEKLSLILLMEHEEKLNTCCTIMHDIHIKLESIDKINEKNKTTDELIISLSQTKNADKAKAENAAYIFLNENCGSLFTDLIIVLSDIGKSRIAKLLKLFIIKKEYDSAYESEEDLWQTFLITRLPKTILYTYSTNVRDKDSLRRYFYTSIGNLCLDVRRKYLNKRRREYRSFDESINKNDNGKNDSNKVDNIMTKTTEGIIDKIVREEENRVQIKNMINFIGGRRPTVERKLVFLCLKLGVILGDDEFYLLEKFKGQPISAVASFIEENMSIVFGVEDYMKTIFKEIEEKLLAETLFIEELDINTPQGVREIRTMTREIREKFKNEYINNFNR